MTLLLVTEANCKRSLDLSVGVDLYQGLLKHTEDQLSGAAGLKNLLIHGQQNPDLMELLQGSLCGLCSTLTGSDGFCQSNLTTPVSTVTTPRTTPTTSFEAPEPEWKRYENYCVSDKYRDLKGTPNSAGNENVAACKSECDQHFRCSAIEWYQNWELSDKGGRFRCFLMNTYPPATQGSPGKRYKDAECYVKPSKGPQWKRYPNNCVSAKNEDLTELHFSGGDANESECKSLCDAVSEVCSAIEWYEKGRSRGSLRRCFLILDQNNPEPATQGATRGREDAACYVNRKYGQTQN